MKMKLDSQTKQSYLFLFKWIIISLLAGLSGSLVVRSFVILLTKITSMLVASGIYAPIWAVAGALIAGGVIYKFKAESAEEGMPSYIRGLRAYKGDLSFSVTFFKYWAALITLSTFGSGGIVGPLGRVSAGVMSFFGKMLRRIGFSEDDQQSATICGLAGAVAAIFHSSIGAGIFAVEIIQRERMSYKDIFPSILASSTAVFICKVAEWPTFYTIKAADWFAVDQLMHIDIVSWLLVLALLSGIVGNAYTRLYAAITKNIKRGQGNVLLKVVVGSLIASLLAWAVNPHLLGTSTEMFISLLEGNIPTLTGRLENLSQLTWILLMMMILKGVGNCITVGSGMSGGFTGPAALIGMLLGSSVASFVGIPLHTPIFHAFIAAGFSGVLASSMNIPLAAAVMTIEIFGLQYSFPAGFSVVLAFQIAKHRTIYNYALKVSVQGLDDDWK